MNKQEYNYFSGHALVCFEQLIDLQRRAGEDEIDAAIITGLIRNGFDTDLGIALQAVQWFGEFSGAGIKELLDKFDGPDGLWTRREDGTYRLN